MSVGTEPRPVLPRIPNDGLSWIALLGAFVCGACTFANIGIIDWEEYQPAVRATIVGSGLTALVAGIARLRRRG